MYFKNLIFYILLFIYVLALCVNSNALDYDLWARLVMGKHVIQTGSVLYNDIYSYTPTHTWYDPEWLTSALFYLVQSKFSAFGLTILKASLFYLLLIAITFAIRGYKKSKEKLNLGYYLFILLILNQLAFILGLRCQVISFIFLSIWILILEKIKQGNNKLLCALPFLMLLWLNSHGACIAGVGILFLYGIGEFLNKNEYKKYFIALFFVCLVFFINPWGFEYIQFMFKSAVIDRSWINEWQSPLIYPFRTVFWYYIFLISAFFVYIYKIKLKKLKFNNLNKTKLILLLTVTILSLKYIKHAGLLVTIYSIYLYDDYFLIFNHLMNKLKNYLQFTTKACENIVLIKNILFYLCIFVFSFYVLLTKPIATSHNIATFNFFPVIPMEFLKENNIKGNLFSEFFNNSFIGYKGYPDIKIFLDGRQEQVYDSEIFDKSMFFIKQLGYTPELVVDKYKTDIFLLAKGGEKLNYFKNNPKFKLIYDDTRYVILIDKKLDKFSYKYPIKSVQYYMEHIFDTNIDFKKENK